MSATSLPNIPGVLLMGIPRSLQAAKSTLSTPTPHLTAALSFPALPAVKTFRVAGSSPIIQPSNWGTSSSSSASLRIWVTLGVVISIPRRSNSARKRSIARSIGGQVIRTLKGMAENGLERFSGRERGGMR